MNISVIGLGKLGLCTAACFAAAGHKVLGYDISWEVRAELKSGRNPIEETGLTELLQMAGDNLQVVESYDESAEGSEIIMIIVPTPSMANGHFNNSFLVKAIEELAPAISRKSNYCVVDVVSTVMPGSCESVFRPLLESRTGKRCGTDFGLVYNPEFIALGSVIHNFLNPDMVLIGSSDPRSAEMVRELYGSTCKSSPAMAVMSLINAEIAKISLNCFVTMKISYANRLAAICERFPGADVDVITTAIGADSRVGSKGLKGGLGFGGPCFPRDNIAFQAFAREPYSHTTLTNAVVEVNHSIPQRLYSTIASHCPRGSKVAMLGLAYKPHTHIIERSPSVSLAMLLSQGGYDLVVHDPKALAAAQTVLQGSVEYRDDPYACVAGCHAVALLTDWPQYRALDWQRIATLAQPGALVIDSWRVARDSDLSAFVYRPVGIGVPTEEDRA